MSTPTNKNAIAPKPSAAKSEKKKTRSAKPSPASTLGEFAVQKIRDEYRQMVKQEKPVLADKDPENLHQMRVSSRRLYTALQIFGSAIDLPKAAASRRVRTLTKVLGKLRDLDVQLQALREDYLTQLDNAEQAQLNSTLERLGQRRRKAFAGTQDALSQSRYQDLKTAFESWLPHPHLTPIAAIPITLILPDLLTPLLSHSLLHPGWLISAEASTDDNVATLHDLRKACKHARYQAEFFVPFYGDEFKAWIKGLKDLQDHLGGLQDIEVLQHLLQQDSDANETNFPQLHQAIQEKRQGLLAYWETSRQPYLERDFRYHLHQILLEPTQV